VKVRFTDAGAKVAGAKSLYAKKASYANDFFLYVDYQVVRNIRLFHMQTKIVIYTKGSKVEFG
jgi:hypothetical protein